MKSTPLPRVTLDAAEWTRARRPVAQGEILAPPSWPGAEPIAKRLSRLLGSHDRVLRGAKFMGEHLGCGLSRYITDFESKSNKFGPVTKFTK